nr:hypothetical protein CFP56_37374 [Quercus suber]
MALSPSLHCNDVGGSNEASCLTTRHSVPSTFPLYIDVRMIRSVHAISYFATTATLSKTKTTKPRTSSFACCTASRPTDHTVSKSLQAYAATVRDASSQAASSQQASHVAPRSSPRLACREHLPTHLSPPAASTTTPLSSVPVAAPSWLRLPSGTARTGYCCRRTKARALVHPCPRGQEERKKKDGSHLAPSQVRNIMDHGKHFVSGLLGCYDGTLRLSTSPDITRSSVIHRDVLWKCRPDTVFCCWASKRPPYHYLFDCAAVGTFLVLDQLFPHGFAGSSLRRQFWHQPSGSLDERMIDRALRMHPLVYGANSHPPGGDVG